MSERAADLLGVRPRRRGPMLFVESGGVRTIPGDRVVVVLAGSRHECEATVSIGTGQLLAAAIGAPDGRVVRLVRDGG